MGAILYILRCSDGSYYVGTTQDSLEKRVSEHQRVLSGSKMPLRSNGRSRVGAERKKKP